MNMPLIGGDKIRSLIKNATKDSSTGSNESLMKTNTRDSNNMIKDSNQLEMDRKNKIIVDNLKKSGGIVNKTQGIIGDIKKSEPKNMGGGINVSQGGNLNNSEIKSNGNINNPKNFIGVNAFDNLRRLGGIKVEDEKEKNSGRLGNEYKGIEYYTENSEKMGKAINDLYKVTNNVLSRGEDVDIMRIKDNFPEFGGLDDDVLGNLISDVKNMVVDGNDNLKELVDAYPELGLVSSIDLGMNGRVEMINGLMNDDDGILDWVLDKLGVEGAVKRKTGKSIKENLADWANDSRDKKKIALGGNEIESAFLRDLHERYKEYTNENGEWLPNATDEIKKQYKKEWDKYENKAALRAAGNFFKGLPSYLELGYNMVNHLPEMVKALGGLVVGGALKGGEYLDDKTRINGLDKWANRRGYENWEELKEVAMENMANKGGWLNNFLLTSDSVTDSFLDYLDDTYGGIFQGDMTKIEQNLQERGEDILSDAMAVLDIVNGVGKASGMISPETSSKLRSVTNMLDPANVGVNLVTGGTKAIAKAEGRVITKTLGKGMKAISGGKDVLEKSFLGKGAEMVLNQLTNLTKEERDFIRNNYDIVEQYLKGNRNAEDIAEVIRRRMDDLLDERRGVGEFYDFIKNNDKALVKVGGAVDGVKKMLDNLGIKVGGDGMLKFGDLSFTPSQQRQLQQVYSYVRALEDLGDNATAKDVWRARQLIDSLADWEGNSKRGLDAEVMGSIRDMRSKIDDALKEQVVGFKEADTEYRELSNLVKELRKDWFDKEGNLKDSSLSKIRNLTRAGNEAKLERLEKHFPNITESLKGLAVAQSVEKAGKAMVGQYAKQIMTVGGIFGLISGDLSLATALLGMAILTPKNLVKILKMQSNFENSWKRIANKLDNGEVLSARDNKRLRNWLRRNESGIIDDVEEARKGKDWEQVDMDKVDLEYDKAQREAYVRGKSTEKKLTKEERASLLKKYAKGSENNGFVMKIVDDMGEGTHGMADLDRKLVKLEENFGDTTAQHEFFHELFSVIDEDTKKYVINEVKNYLDLTDDVAAEEWLAESFGIYARRKEIKLGNIRLKGNRLQRFQSKLRDLFQRAYEWIQNYSMDRKTINKLFNEVYGAVDGKVLDESGKFNLAEKLGINEKTPKLGVSENGLRYKKAGNLGKNDYKETAVKAQHDGLGEKTPLTAVRGQNFNDSGLFGGNKDSKGHYIIKGGREKQVIYTKINNGKAKFSGYKMDLQEKNRKYYDNVVNALNRFEKRGYNGKDILIGKTPRGNDIFITDKDLVHIFKEHGEFYIENLIESVNNGRDGFWEIESNKNYNGVGLRPRMEIEIPGKNEKFIVGLMSDGSDEFNSTRYNVKSLRESKPSQVESRGGVRFKKDNTGKELSKGQQEYFKDSKIRDADGNLLRVYHGTHNDFTVFDRNKIGTNTNNKGIFGEGFYATSKESFANMYAGKGYSKEGLEGKVMEGYVDIKNPFMRNDYKGEVALEKLRKELGLGKNVIKLNRLDNMIHPLIEPKQSEKFRAALERAGYDGVVFKYPEGGGDEIVAFNSNQFKNIDNLNPTKNPDIRYKKSYTPEELMKEFKFSDSKDKKAEEIANELSKNLKRYEKKGEKFTLDYLIGNIEEYKKGKVEYDEFLDDIANDVDGKALKPTLKILKGDGSFNGNGIARALEKADSRLSGIDGVTDIVRGSVIVNDMEGIDGVRKYLKKKGYEVDDKYSMPTELGYMDLSTLYETKNGIKAEIQVNIPEMLVAKDGEEAIKMGAISKADYDKIIERVGVEGGMGHKYYESYRSLKEKKKTAVSLDERNKINEEMKKIEKESKAYYKKFMKNLDLIF